MSIFTVLVAATMTGQVNPQIVPKPVSMEMKQGSFAVNDRTQLYFSPKASDTAEYFRDVLSPSTGFSFPTASKPRDNAFNFVLKDSDLGPEGYKLMVTSRRVTVEAETEAGLFYGIQTIRQLLPPENLRKGNIGFKNWTIPALEIEDYPRFQWRGLMMDVARHFAPKDDVLKMIDLLAIHKMNSLHIHLTDDQGWRVEIKKYPKLTEVGAWRKETVIGRNSGEFDGTPHGGFYTQEDLKEIVAYAKVRHINVVPEIDMPGHMVAAISAYPELGTGEPDEVMNTWGVSSHVLNTSPETVQFCKDVLSELIAIFPSKFIHVGGDECPKTQWENDPKEQARMKERGLKDAHELQSWFIQQMDNFLNSKGRRLIGWDEILEGGLAENATVMSWRGTSGGIQAARQGHDVVMSPTSHLYLDYYQSRDPNEPLAIGGYVPIEKVYSFNPVPEELNEAEAKHILGLQGNLWAEYIKTFDHMEYMAFPRGCAVAEIGWTPQADRNFDDFTQRMQGHYPRLDALCVNYRHPTPIETPVAKWVSGSTTEEFAVMKWDITSAIQKPGKYQVAFQFTEGGHRLDIAWAELWVDGDLAGRDEHEGTTGGFTSNNIYTFTIAELNKGDQVELRANVRSDGGTDSAGNIYVSLVK